jgi:hypothetical protein
VIHRITYVPADQGASAEVDNQAELPAAAEAAPAEAEAEAEAESSESGAPAEGLSAAAAEAKADKVAALIAAEGAPAEEEAPAGEEGLPAVEGRRWFRPTDEIVSMVDARPQEKMPKKEAKPRSRRMSFIERMSDDTNSRTEWFKSNVKRTPDDPSKSISPKPRKVRARRRSMPIKLDDEIEMPEVTGSVKFSPSKLSKRNPELGQSCPVVAKSPVLPPIQALERPAQRAHTSLGFTEVSKPECNKSLTNVLCFRSTMLRQGLLLNGRPAS